MKMSEAMEVIEGKWELAGYMVSFSHAGDGFLRSDHFPDKHAGEKLIPTEIEAWRLANSFAAATKGRCVNIYVVDSRFCPVNGYKDKLIENR